MHEKLVKENKGPVIMLVAHEAENAASKALQQKSGFKDLFNVKIPHYQISNNIMGQVLNK